MTLRIGIAGTRGIPNFYGGFEQVAACLAKGLAEKGHEVTVYNPHNHPYKKNTWNGVTIIHCYDPELFAGTAGQFLYDLNCITDARKRQFDILLVLGYTSSSVWGRYYPKKSIVITNMDGLEWKRTKYTRPVQRFLQYAEKLAIRHSDYYIADSPVIQEYLQDKYPVTVKYISYGAEIMKTSNAEPLSMYGISRQNYFLLMARMEPENNIEMILDGFRESHSIKKCIIIGSTENKFGRYLVDKYRNEQRIQFMGPVYDPVQVQSLTANAYLYFHGHSVGGTNPSLLEAMAARVLIAAHDNPFNSAVLTNDAYYFSDTLEVRHIIDTLEPGVAEQVMITNNLRKIENEFNWANIVDQYEQFFLDCYANKS